MAKAVKGLLVPADSALPVREVTLYSLADYQQAVGGYIEAVWVPSLNIEIYVNENGIAERLPYNGRITALWWYHDGRARTHSALLGNAVIVGPVDDDGDETDIPEGVRELAFSTEKWVVLMKVDGTWYRHRNVNRDYWEAIFWALVKNSRESEIKEISVATEAEVQAFPLRPIPPIGRS